jgi:hypothetical protein
MTQNPLTETVSRLIDAGCHYRLEALAELYAPDLTIIIVQEDGSVASFDYEQNMAFFRQLRDVNAPPLNTAVTYNHTAEQQGIGYVVATRQMNLGAGEKKNRLHPDAAPDRRRIMANLSRTRRRRGRCAIGLKTRCSG